MVAEDSTPSSVAGDGAGLPHALVVAWGLERTPQRGPSRGLSHREIVEAAVAIADADGLDAVTMGRVARALGRTPMSLYRYVSTKEDLLLLMQDGVPTLSPQSVAAIRTPVPGEDPVDGAVRRLRLFADGLREIYLAHPWLVDMRRSALSVLLPGSMQVADLGVNACDGLRLDNSERIGVILTLSSYISSTVALERDLGREDRVVLGEDAWRDLGGAVLSSPDHARIAALVLSGDYAAGGPQDQGPGRNAGDGGDGVDAEYAFGLGLLLDGIVAQHRRRESAGTHGATLTPATVPTPGPATSPPGAGRTDGDALDDGRGGIEPEAVTDDTGASP